jgi:hypothetical protein
VDPVDLGVGEDDQLVGELVLGEAGELTVEVSLVPVPVGVVRDVDRVRHAAGQAGKATPVLAWQR